MTREEAIRQLKIQIMPIAPIARIEAIEMAISALQQEKEPAPSANDASSKQKSTVNNDTSEKAKCQDLPQLIGNLKMIYDGLSEAERRFWLLGEVFAELGRIIQEDRQ